jgi:hypothetical protein
MSDKEEKKPTCGIVMPISAIDGCSEAHWLEVRAILTDSIEAAGFEPNLVSDADDVGIIQKRIIQNLYDNPIVVCDVSGKNPNVMFELGMRLAFDKPTIIVKDDVTSFAFDTSPIEHLGYPRDLRFARIVDFKAVLTEKIRKTHEKATSDPTYTTFLKHFGEFTVAKIDKKEVSGQEFILEELRNMRHAIGRLESRNVQVSVGGDLRDTQRMSVNIPGLQNKAMKMLIDNLSGVSGIDRLAVSGVSSERVLEIDYRFPARRALIESIIDESIFKSTTLPSRSRSTAKATAELTSDGDGNEE